MMDAVQKALRVAKADGGGNVQGFPDPVGTPAVDNSAFVTGLYQDVLGRAPDTSGMQDWLGALNAGAMNQGQVREAFLASPENTVQDLYGNLLNRGLTNDPGAAQWVQGLAGGALTPAQVRAGIMESPEYQKLNPTVGGGSGSSGSGAGAGSSTTLNNSTVSGSGRTDYIPMNVLQGGAPVGKAAANARGMPLVYTPPPYKDYGATAAAFRVASGLENLPSPYFTLSPVVGGTPANYNPATGYSDAALQPKTTYQDILNQFIRTPSTLTGGTGNDTLKGGTGNDTLTKGNATLADISALYQRYLGRTPERGAAESWFDQIRSGQMTYADVLNSIKGSPEATVYGSYQNMLGRGLENDPGAQQWISALAAGQITPQEFQAGVKSSPEYTQRQIANAYETYLGRAPEAGAAENWANNVVAGGMTLQEAINAISGSQEAVGNIMGSSDPVAAAYQTYLGRAPEAEGAAAWNNAIASGAMTPDQVVAAIASSPEAQSRTFASGGAVKEYADGGSPDYASLVNAAYRDFLYRDPDEKGFNDWLTALNRGEIKPADFESRFKGAGYEDEIANAYMQYLDRPPEKNAAANWIGQINDKSMTLDQVLQAIRSSPESLTMPTYRNVPTPDKYSELQGGRMYDIDIGRGERIPKLGVMDAPVNVKQEWENSEIARLQAELEAAKAASTSKTRDMGGGGGGGEGGSNFGASDPSGTSGAIGVDAAGGAQGPGMDSSGASGVGEGTSGLWARGGRTGNNAIDNALRLLKADRR